MKDKCNVTPCHVMRTMNACIHTPTYLLSLQTHRTNPDKPLLYKFGELNWKLFISFNYYN